MVTVISLLGRFSIYFYFRLWNFNDFFEGNWTKIMPYLHYYFYIDEFFINLVIIWYFYFYNRKVKQGRKPEIVV